MAANVDDIFQIDDVVAARQGDNGALEIGYRVEVAGRFKDDLLSISKDFTTGNDDVARFKNTFELKGRQAEFRKSGVLILDKDPFLLDALNADFGDVRTEQQLIAAVVGNLFEFRVAEILTADGDNDAEDITEFIVDEGADHFVG